MAALALPSGSSLFHRVESSFSSPSCIHTGPCASFLGLEWEREWSHQAKVVRRGRTRCTCPSLSAHWTTAENSGP